MERFRELFEGITEKKLKINGYSVEIIYQAPKGYYAIGKSPEIKGNKVINKTYFDSSDEAIEHAEMEIDGYES